MFGFTLTQRLFLRHKNTKPLMFERPARTDLICFKVLKPHPYKTLCHWYTQVYKPTIKFNSNFSFLFAAFAWEWSRDFSCHRQFKLQLQNQEVSFSFPTPLLNCILHLYPTIKLCIPSSAENFNVTKISSHEY